MLVIIRMLDSKACISRLYVIEMFGAIHLADTSRKEVLSTHIYNRMYSLKPRAIIHISEQLVVECRLIRKSVYSHNNFCTCVCVCVCGGGGVGGEYIQELLVI